MRNVGKIWLCTCIMTRVEGEAEVRQSAMNQTFYMESPEFPTVEQVSEAALINWSPRKHSVKVKSVTHMEFQHTLKVISTPEEET